MTSTPWSAGPLSTTAESVPWHDAVAPTRDAGRIYGPNDAEQWLADHEAWLTDQDAEPTYSAEPVIRRTATLDAARLSGTVSLDALETDPSDRGLGDPQSRYATVSGKATQRAAIRQALRRSLDLQAIQESIRQQSNGERYGAKVAKGFDGNGGEIKAARYAALRAHRAILRVSSDALLPYGGTGNRSAVSASPDPLTYASPVVASLTNVSRFWTVSGAGEVTLVPALTARKVIAVEMHAQRREEGDYVTEIVPLSWLSAGDAIGRTDPEWIANFWTGHAPDRATQAADRFALKRRPTADLGQGSETSDPLPAVRKPSSRKRKRDGALGGPAILSHR